MGVILIRLSVYIDAVRNINTERDRLIGQRAKINICVGHYVHVVCGTLWLLFGGMLHQMSLIPAVMRTVKRQKQTPQKELSEFEVRYSRFVVVLPSSR